MKNGRKTSHKKKKLHRNDWYILGLFLSAEMKNEKKLLEAFRTFMEKGVIPKLPEDHIITN